MKHMLLVCAMIGKCSSSMKLLIITQKVDSQDSVLGFFHRWLEEFAAHCESLTVICLYEGTHALPHNVKVLSLGKERGVSRLTYIARFFRYIWQERNHYDSVFVHMNPIYAVLGGLFWRLIGKRIALWYIHGHDDMRLRLGVLLAHRVFTAVPESFPFISSKIAYVGHGIDMSLFDARSSHGDDAKIQLLNVGRISPKKHIKELIDHAVECSHREMLDTITFVGDPGSNDEELFFEKMKIYAQAQLPRERVLFTGGVPHAQLVSIFQSHDYFIHLSSTGGLDKVVIESWCSGTPAFTNQKGFESYFGDDKIFFMFQDMNAVQNIDTLQAFHTHPDREAINARVTQLMRKTFDIKALVGRVMSYM